MILIYLIVNYLYRKYGVPLHNFFENWTRGISHLNVLFKIRNMELNFNVDKRTPPPLLPVLVILKECHFSIRSFIITIRKENYYIWGQISTLKIDPQRSPCWKLTPFGVTFQRVRQFSTIGWCFFFQQMSVEKWPGGSFYNAGLFSTLHRTEKSRNIDGNERSNKTTLNINIFLMECTKKFKFGMMTHHYLFNSLGYSMMPYDLDRNFQGRWYRVYCIWRWFG